MPDDGLTRVTASVAVPVDGERDAEGIVLVAFRIPDADVAPAVDAKLRSIADGHHRVLPLGVVLVVEEARRRVRVAAVGFTRENDWHRALIGVGHQPKGVGHARRREVRLAGVGRARRVRVAVHIREVAEDLDVLPAIEGAALAAVLVDVVPVLEVLADLIELVVGRRA